MMEYVFSAPAMLRILSSQFEIDNPTEYAKTAQIMYEGLHRLRDEVSSTESIKDMTIGILFNAYVEKTYDTQIRKHNLYGFKNLYADSGGLQVVTAGKTITDEFKKEIYQVQSNSQFAMCFDEIPCETRQINADVGSNRSMTSNKVYFPERAEACAIKTAQNIREQIEVLTSLGSSTKVLYIVQGNSIEEMVEWFRVGSKELDSWHWDHIAGLAMADTCIGNGVLESVDMLVAYHLIRKEFPIEMVKNHMHLLGVGSIRRLMPLLYLMKSGFFPEELHVSFDSTTFSMAYFMGRFHDLEGKRIFSNDLQMRDLFESVYDYFSDIFNRYVPGIDKNEFLDFIMKTRRSVSDTTNDAESHMTVVVRAYITLCNIWQILGFSRQVKKSLDTCEHHSMSPVGKLQFVKSYEDYIDWKTNYSRFVRSARIDTTAPNSHHFPDVVVHEPSNDKKPKKVSTRNQKKNHSTLEDHWVE